MTLTYIIDRFLKKIIVPLHVLMGTLSLLTLSFMLFCLLIPIERIKKTGLFEVRETLLLYAVPVCVISAVFPLAHSANRYWIGHKMHNCLKNLTSTEQKLLRFYIENNSHTQRLFLSGEAEGLVRSGILVRTVEITNPEYPTRYDYNIELSAFDYLRKYPGLVLGLAKNGIEKDET